MGMRKGRTEISLTTRISAVCGLALCALAFTNGVAWKLNWRVAHGAGRIQGTEKHSGKRALATSVESVYGKCMFLRMEKIKVNPGEKYILSGWCKSTTGKKSGARIMLQYLDAKGKYTTCSHGIYCGGEHDWKAFKRVETIPDGVAFVRIVAGSYQVPGKSWFDDLKFVKADAPNVILVSDGFEDVPEK